MSDFADINTSSPPFSPAVSDSNIDGGETSGVGNRVSLERAAKKVQNDYVVPSFYGGNEDRSNMPADLIFGKTPNLHYGDRNCQGEKLDRTKEDLKRLEKWYSSLSEDIRTHLTDVALKERLIAYIKKGTKDDRVHEEEDDAKDFTADNEVELQVSDLDGDKLTFGGFQEWMESTGTNMKQKRIRLLNIIYEIKYPKLPKDSHHLDQSPFKRETRRRAWTNLRKVSDEINLKKKVPTPVLKSIDFLFRIDSFGNVVSAFARKDGACAGHFDHKFPWIRGGLTNDINLAKESNIDYIHSKANLIKNAGFVHLIDVDILKTGMNARAFCKGLTSINGFEGVPMLDYCLEYTGWKDVKIPSYLEQSEEDIKGQLRTLFEYKESQVLEYQKLKLGHLEKLKSTGKNASMALKKYPYRFIQVQLIQDLLPEGEGSELTVEEKLTLIRDIVRAHYTKTKTEPED